MDNYVTFTSPSNKNYGSILYTITPTADVQAELQYKETIEALRFLHGIESSAYKLYLSYADKAEADNYKGISNLFRALAFAEKIHANAFKNFLLDLNVNEPPEIITYDVRNTQKNLRNAIENELYHIEIAYPNSIKNIQYEKHDNIINYINFAHQSEKLHRNLLKKMRSAMGLFFNTVASQIDKRAKRFHICPFCGSAFENFPNVRCPICSSPSKNFIYLLDGHIIGKSGSEWKNKIYPA